MTVLITCSKCGWIGSNCYMGLQFDKKDRCALCQPPKKQKKVKRKKINWEKVREKYEID